MTSILSSTTYRHSFGDEPLPGYRLVAPLGRGGFGEVWKCHAPGGLHKAIKFVQEEENHAPNALDSLEQEYQAFQRVKGIRHPFLLTLERVELIGGELIQVMELADQSLAQRYDECRQTGLAGIPRDELLAYMVDAAEALDVLSLEHGLQHLDVKPANLFVVGGHVKVGDYGLVSRHVTATAGDRRLEQGYTPRYVAPEVLDGLVDARSDQYPLALIYQELLTGRYPYPGPSARHLMVQHKTAQPDVSPLPLADRPAVARALAKDPADRFPACLQFVKALLSVVTPPPVPPSQSSVRTASLSMSAITRLVTPNSRDADGATDGATFVTQRIGMEPLKTRSGPLTLAPRQLDDLTRACPGYHMVAELECGPRGRRVKATDPTGRVVRVKLLRLDGGTVAELDAILASLAEPHPQLWQVVCAGHPRAVGFVAPDNAVPIGEWLKTRREQGHPPLGANDAAVRLTPVAQALDEMGARTGFPHGLVSDQTVLTADDRTGLTGYGVAELLRRSSPNSDWHTADPFLAPEMVAGNPHPASDQYSLALLVLQLIGAWTPPARGERDRSIRINWDLMSEAMRVAVRTALHPNPTQRHPSCREFLAALQPNPTDGVVLDQIRLIETVARLTRVDAPRGQKPPPDQLILSVLKVSATGSDHPESGGKPLTLPDGRVSVCFPIRWTPGLSELKTTAFKDLFRFTVIQLAPDTTLLKPVSILGLKSEPIELVVRWPLQAKAGMAEVSVIGRWTGGMDKFRGVPIVAAMLDQFRRVVQNSDDRRKAPRMRTKLTAEFYPVGEDLQVGPMMAGRCRDLSATGLSVTLPGAFPSSHAFVRFPGIEGADDYAVLAQRVWSNPAGTSAVLTGWRFVHAGDGR